MSKRKSSRPSSKPVVLRPSDYDQKSYLQRKSATNKQIASHRHRSR